MSTTPWRLPIVLISIFMCYFCIVEGGEVPEKELCIKGESWVQLVKVFLAEFCGEENCCVTGSQWEAWAALAKAFLPALHQHSGEAAQVIQQKRFMIHDWFGKK